MKINLNYSLINLQQFQKIMNILIMWIPVARGLSITIYTLFPKDINTNIHIYLHVARFFRLKVSEDPQMQHKRI
jgi:hypothetical protein